MAKLRVQLVANILSPDFGIDGKERIRTIIGDDDSLFSHARKMVLFEALVEKYAERKGNGLPSFNQKAA